MTLTEAANFLTGSILFALGAIVISGMILVINNMFTRYWKPITWLKFEQVHPYHQELKVEPSHDSSTPQHQ
jgi:hypothetical protein